MSLSDLKKEKLDELKKTLSDCPGFSFRESLTEAFRLDGGRTFINPIPRKLPETFSFMEPVITPSKTIRPIMSTPESPKKEITSTNVEIYLDRDVEEGPEDLASIISSISLLSQEAPTINPERRSGILKELLGLPTRTLYKLTQSVDFTSWHEETVSDLCREIQLLKDASNSASLFLIEAVIYPKIAETDTTLSRLLMNSVISLAKDQGKLVLDSLVILILFEGSAGRPQIDVVGKISSESLKPAQRLLLLQLILSDGQMPHSSRQSLNNNRRSLRPWNEAVFQLIGGILTSQPLLALTKETLEEILQTTRSVVDSSPKNKSSMQLLLIITSKYAQAVAEFGCIEVAENIANASKMFLKRAVLGQINNIKKNQKALQESKVG